VPKFKKRDIERKGDKKMESLEIKLLINDLKETKGTGGES